MSMPRVLIDACGWVAVIEAGINIDQALLESAGTRDLILVPSVLAELKSMEDRRLLLDMLEARCEIVEALPESSNHTDDQLHDLAVANDWIVLTVDTGLKRRLSQSGMAWLEVSGRSHLRLVRQ
jgi:rRNA-processing protein FCF1